MALRTAFGRLKMHKFSIDDDTIIIEMKKKRHLPILLDALEAYEETPIPWLEDKKLLFKLWSTS